MLAALGNGFTATTAGDHDRLTRRQVEPLPFVVVDQLGGQLSSGSSLFDGAAMDAERDGHLVERQHALSPQAAAAVFETVPRAKPPDELFTDSADLACIEQPGMGGMGVHYRNQVYTQSGTLDPARPQALVYQRTSGGRLQLGAVEYLVFQADWDAGHSTPP